jgi:hypothetical protein
MRKLTKLSIFILMSLYVAFTTIFTTIVFIGVANGYYDGIYILVGILSVMLFSSAIVPFYETLKEIRF